MDRPPAHRQHDSAGLSAVAVDLLIGDVNRAAAFGDDPQSSSLWVRAPWHLRNKYADARCDRATFWLMLSRWLEFQQRSAA